MDGLRWGRVHTSPPIPSLGLVAMVAATQLRPLLFVPYRQPYPGRGLDNLFELQLIY